MSSSSKSAYFQPRTLKEASDLLIAHPRSAKLVAGGTDLVPALSRDHARRVKVISLKKLEELKGIRQHGKNEVFIGAMTTHSEVAESPLINKYFPALSKASSLVGSPSIRNLGTIGGNIANASPSADTAPPLLAYGAKAIIRGQAGEKQVPIEHFFTGPSAHILAKGEILRGFVLTYQEESFSDYEKLGIRKAMEIAIASACVSIGLRDGIYCQHIRIALGAVAPTPIRAVKAEKIVEGKTITPDLIRKAARVAMQETRPISDIRASADYRKKMVASLVERLVLHASSTRAESSLKG
ncbi:MAG: xanthine dehydrogenase family protein subunit M [Deltaproteobacteria bacterium]|nr:MAG: xanthine dehydrogenase family protein subunit M [Deltaproteobacteria bacterium]